MFPKLTTLTLQSISDRLCLLTVQADVTFKLTTSAIYSHVNCRHLLLLSISLYFTSQSTIFQVSTIDD